MIALVDYGLGNIQAFANVYRSLGRTFSFASTPRQLTQASHIILPGVGSFDWAMGKLAASGLREALDEAVLDRRTPILGVCVGMQMMAGSSEEGQAAGLGWVDAKVTKLAGTIHDLRLPHMGWNSVTTSQSCALFRDLTDPQFYFLHSYCVHPSDPQATVGSTEYGEVFTSAFAVGNIFGTQFHPEKSHEWGVGLLKNFAEI